MDDWIFFTPNTDIYEINIYDDGNHKYESYVNEWHINGRWQGKCCLVNRANPAITIRSISEWKISRL